MAIAASSAAITPNCSGCLPRADAAQRSYPALRLGGDAIMTDADYVLAALGKIERA
jgi:hypothetical protein